jgi:Cu2+-containing amine oxidase
MPTIVKAIPEITILRYGERELSMRKIPTPLHSETAEEIDLKVETLTAEAMGLPSGAARQTLLAEAAKYRAYANIKRWASQRPVERKKRVDL